MKQYEYFAVDYRTGKKQLKRDFARDTVALFENEKLAAVKDMKLIDFDGNAEFDIELKKENKYQIKILAFDENQRPKMQSYSMSIK